MENIEEKLGTILSNPQMMQQIMGMAQALGQSSSQTEEPSEPTPPPVPELDLSIVQKLSGIAGQNKVDREQQALLSALSPYLSNERICKLEKAMRAAKMAKLASSFLGSGGLQFLTGR